MPESNAASPQLVPMQDGSSVALSAFRKPREALLDVVSSTVAVLYCLSFSGCEDDQSVDKLIIILLIVLLLSL